MVCNARPADAGAVRRIELAGSGGAGSTVSGGAAFGPSLLLVDPWHNIYISLHNLPAEKSKSRRGMFIHGSDGRTRFCPNLMLLQDAYSLSPAPLFADGGKTIWTGGSFSATGGARRLDCSADPPAVEALPDSVFTFVEALADNGTVFLTMPEPVGYDPLYGPFATPVRVYRPAASDDRRIVKALTFESSVRPAVSPPAVASDGTIWAS